MRLHALVDIRLSSPDAAPGFEEHVRRSPYVTEALCLTGRADYLVRVACPEPSDLEGLLRELKAQAGALETETRLILHRVPIAAPETASSTRRP